MTSEKIPALLYKQGTRAWYTVVFTLAKLAKLFLVSDNPDIPIRERIQRRPVKSRGRLIAGYMLGHPDNWAFPAITASFAGRAKFLPIPGTNGTAGYLSGDLGEIFINDGQHRVLGIGAVLEEHPEFADQQISVSLTKHMGTEDAQTLFATFNGHQKPTPPGLNITFEHDETTPSGVASEVTRRVADQVFPGYIEESGGGSVSRGSGRMFSNVSLKASIMRLISQQQIKLPALDWSVEGQTANACEFYQACLANITTWQLITSAKQESKDVRAESLVTHGNFLRALGEIGGRLRSHELTRDNWQDFLEHLGTVDLNRTNPELLRRGITGPGGSDGTINAKSDRQARDRMVEYLSESLGLPLELSPTRKLAPAIPVAPPMPIPAPVAAPAKAKRKYTRTGLVRRSDTRRTAKVA